jgi:hypothetical protein
MARPGTKRKLLPEVFLEQLASLSVQGVPKSRIIKDYSLDLTPPTLSGLINDYLIMKTLLGHKQKARQQVGKKMQLSLFPSWLDPSFHAVQIEPAGARYSGSFPFGDWESNNNVNAKRLHQIEVAHGAAERAAEKTRERRQDYT